MASIGSVPVTVILDIKADGTGLAVGKEAEDAGLDIGWPLTGSTAAGGEGVLVLGTHCIQWGSLSILPSADGVPTKSGITFSRQYRQQPAVFLTAVSSVPEQVSLGVADMSTAGATAVLTGTGMTETGINWLAIGPV